MSEQLTLIRNYIISFQIKTTQLTTIQRYIIHLSGGMIYYNTHDKFFRMALRLIGCKTFDAKY